MAAISATLDTHLRVDDSNLPLSVWMEIEKVLTFPNRERQNAMREKRHGWKDMPLNIHLWDVEDGRIVLPRGFRWQMEQGLAELGLDLDLKDSRTRDRMMRLAEPINLRPHQGPAVDAILEAEDGIYQAPTGSGKTVTVLEAVRRACMARNIVVVDKIEIAEQWADRAKQYLPSYDIGIIGAGKWDEQRLTIAMQQTLRAKIEELDLDDWWKRWGLACLDECHHQTAETFQDVMSRFRGQYRFGVSATPRKTGDFEYAEAVLGDIFHITPLAPLRKAGILVKPTINIVEPDFNAQFWSTHYARGKHCVVPGCDKKKRHMHRNNYQSVTKALREDRARNRLVADWIHAFAGHRQLVVSPQKGHLELLAKTVGKHPDPIYWLTGKETRKQRREVVEAVSANPGSVTFSTTAFEALDVPLLDRGHIPWPTANVDLVRQICGRFVRGHPLKEDAVINDYADVNLPVMAKQLSGRLYGCYYPDDFAVLHPRS